MQITVVIPTYQRPQLLRKCLKALSQQSLPKTAFEIVVVSDGPDDITAAVVNELAGTCNIRCLHLPAKKGPAAARNLGWLSAKAGVIAFTDDDCEPDNGWLQTILNNADPMLPQAFTGRIIVPRSQRPTDYEMNTAGLETADFVTANCACTKKALTVTGGFDERFSMAWREDSDLEFKLICNNIPIRRIASATVVHPVRKANWGVSILEQKKTMFNALLYSKFPELYRQKIQPQPPFLYYLIIAAFTVFLIGIVAAQQQLLVTGALVWLLSTLYFTVKRLQNKSLSIRHILEMAFTSVIIPFSSIYWQWYGAVKYQVLFI